MLISINNNFKHITTTKADKLLKKFVSENISILEVLNGLYIENQLINHNKYYEFLKKFHNENRKVYNIESHFSEKIHEIMIYKYKIHKKEVTEIK